MKIYDKRELLINIFFVIFVYAIINKFINSIVYGDSETSYNITEWLINYKGGFVRRGLRGEIILQLHKYLNVDPYLIIRIITVAAFSALSIFFIQRFIKKGYSVFMLPLVFFLGNPILNSFWLKTDSILCLLFISIIYFYTKQFPLYKLWINLLLIFGILLHEIFFIIYIPILILLEINNNQKINTSANFSIKSLIKPCITLLPAFIVFIITVLNNGNSEVEHKIWDSWQSVPINFDLSNEFIEGQTLPPCLNAMTQNLKDGVFEYSLLFLRDKSKAFSFNLYGPFMLIIIILSIYYTVSNVNKFDCKILKTKPKNNHNKTLISSVLIIQLCVVSLLFILGYDYGRWLFFWITSSFTILLLVPQDKLETAIPEKAKKLSVGFNKLISSFIGESRGTVYLICSLVSFPMMIMYWETPNFLENSSLYIVLSTIGDFFKLLYKIKEAIYFS